MYLFEFTGIENPPTDAPGALQQIQDRNCAAQVISWKDYTCGASRDTAAPGPYTEVGLVRSFMEIAQYRGLGQPITPVGLEFSQTRRTLERFDGAAG